MKAAHAGGFPLNELPCVANKPELAIHLGFEWSAFQSLSTDRETSIALGKIPWSTIDRFAQRHGIDGDDFERFEAIMTAMDDAYRVYQKEKP